MPQLDFTWWVVNFFIIWTAIIFTFTVITANPSSTKVDQTSPTSQTSKETTTWQWL
uniref:ATP synthase F0 subunit 8 n=1 Tax=Phormosoma bursarium TaxID=2962508 RepID=UPI0021142E54|nr:ATP synthase F0 subunit 8 [Phormosoma bursarium]UTD49277.1 ATP synthase F0 subunit 8 [Phormosoma bursarium]